MNDPNSKNLVDRLTQNLAPVTPLPRTSVLSPMIGLISLSGIILFLALGGGIRADWLEIVENPFFAASSLIWLVASALAIGLALKSSIPGNGETPVARPTHSFSSSAVAKAVIAFFGIQAICFLLAPGVAKYGGFLPGVPCSLLLAGLAIIPIGLGIMTIRKLAPVNPRRTANYIGAAAGAGAGFALALHCGSENPIHLILFHLGAAVLVALATPILIVRMLRW